MSDKLSIAPIYRRLQEADLPAAQRLRELAHWNQTGQDWLSLLAMEPQGCFAAEVNGLVVGTVTTTRFHPEKGPGSFGWVGMLLVHPDFRCRGIGTALLYTACDYLRGGGVETIKLDATPLGQPTYLKGGFQVECNLERWAGTPSPRGRGQGEGLQAASLPLSAVSPLTPPDLAPLAGLDKLAFGAKRHAILQRWFRNWPERAIAVREGQRLAGFALARRGANYSQAGPIVCDGQEAGRALLERTLQLFAGQPLILDIFSENTWVRDFVAAAGLSLQRPLVRMYWGPNSAPGQRQKVVAIAGPEVG